MQSTEEEEEEEEEEEGEKGGRGRKGGVPANRRRGNVRISQLCNNRTEISTQTHLSNLKRHIISELN